MSVARALGAAGRKGCRHGCIYCFTQADSFKRCPRFDEFRVRELHDKYFDSEFIQPSIDTELLLLPNWKHFIDEMVAVGKPISFATKSIVSQEQLDYLTKINKILNSTGNFLNVGVTIVKLYNWELIEPHAPSPQERLETLRALKEAGIFTTVLLRPLIPTLTLNEIDEIVAMTHENCYGYLAGPLYVNDRMKEYFKKQSCPINIEMLEVDWQEGSPTLEAVVSRDKEIYLAESALKHGTTLFDGNTDAMLHLKKQLNYKNMLTYDDITLLRTEKVVTLYLIDKSTREICLLHDRNHGRWIPIGGEVLEGETLIESVKRIAKEKINIEISIDENIKISSPISITNFNISPPKNDLEAFCTVQEIVNPVQTSDVHIHQSTVFVAYYDDNQQIVVKDHDKVMVAEWFQLCKINRITTFDNVKFICEQIDNLLTKYVTPMLVE